MNFAIDIASVLDWFRMVFGESWREILGAVLAALLVALGGFVIHRIRKRRIGTQSEVLTTVEYLKRDELEKLTEYLEQVIISNSSLVFGDPTRSSMDSASSPGILVLSQVWTPLRVTTNLKTTSEEPEKSISRPIFEKEDIEFVDKALMHPDKRKLLLLGMPGSGKSTAVSYMAANAAQEVRSTLLKDNARGIAFEDLCKIPVRIILRDVIPSEFPVLSDIWSGVPEIALLKKAKKAGIDDSIRLLEFLMREGKALILMDGLDEVREELLPRVKQTIGLILVACSASRVIITCRTYDYMLALPDRKVNMPITLSLLPFEPDDMHTYVQNWYDAVVKIGRLANNTANRLKKNLISSLDNHPQLNALGRTPLLLALLTLVHTEEGELPKARALVYHRAIRYMLAETAQWRRQAGGATIASADMMSLAQHVAYFAHNELERLGDKFRGLSREELTRLVEEHFGLHEQPIGERYESTSIKVTAHLTRLIQSNGLLLDQGGNKYAFAHRSFQEFLAGQYFAPGSHHEEALQAAKQAHWREAFRLLAGYGAREGNNLFYLLKLIDDLASAERWGSLPKFSYSDTVLAGEMLLEIGKQIILRSGYKWVMDPIISDSYHAGLWYRICRSLIDLVSSIPSKLPVTERIRAAEAIGQLGDLRFLEESGNVRPITDRLISLPKIEFTVGSPFGQGESDEIPQRTFVFPHFSIGRYLVTNLEYAKFIESGGYSNIEYWETDEAKKWLKGDQNFIDLVKKFWIETISEYHAKELRDREIKAEALENEAETRCKPRQQPYYWFDSRFNKPNQPVVGINWWEARAFCTWLTNVGHSEHWLIEKEILRLPTEFEWERASKDKNDSRIFPWGDQWDHDKGHTREDGLKLNEATPVGVYPDGTWLGGPLDLSGNVWEWLENQKRPYDAQHDQLRFSLSSLEDRAIRGSSWYNVPYLARCCSRFIDCPYNLYYDVGFRMIKIEKSEGLLTDSVN